MLAQAVASIASRRNTTFDFFHINKTLGVEQASGHRLPVRLLLHLHTGGDDR